MFDKKRKEYIALLLSQKISLEQDNEKLARDNDHLTSQIVTLQSLYDAEKEKISMLKKTFHDEIHKIRADVTEEYNALLKTYTALESKTRESETKTRESETKTRESETKTREYIKTIESLNTEKLALLSEIHSYKRRLKII